MDIINGIKWGESPKADEDREISFSATLEVKTAKEGKGKKFTVLCAKGKYLANGVLDNEQELDENAYYDLKFTQASGIALPVDPKFNGIYEVHFTGRAWIDTREPEDPEAAKRPIVRLKAKDVSFTRKGKLLSREERAAKKEDLPF